MRLARPGRLFWKLFLAFTLATGTSFFVGVTFVELTRPNAAPLVPAFETPVRIAGLIQTQGLDAARPLLRKDEPVGRIALVRPDGAWVAGDRSIGDDTPGLDVTDIDGTRYRLRVRPYDPFDPNRTMPLLIGVFVSLFFSAGLAWYLARPLTHLSRGLHDVALGKLATRLHPLVGGRRDEIADLTHDFDSMAGQLQQLMASQERLLHDVSHELRSPLARLQVAIGLLRQAPENLPAMLSRVDRETERLDRLIEEVLTLARLKSGTADLAVTQIDVVDLLNAIVDDANFEAQAKGCQVRLASTGPFVTLAFGELLYRAYENVIRNAVKFSPEGTQIDVRCRVEDDRLEVRIEDQGPGVPPDMLAEIFEPFKGGGRSGETDSVGFGLGLAIAKHAVERHRGTICARRGNGDRGLLVVIVIPVTASIAP